MITLDDIHPARIDSKENPTQWARIYMRIMKTDAETRNLLYAQETIETLNTISAQFALTQKETRSVTRVVRDFLIGTLAPKEIIENLPSPHASRIAQILDQHIFKTSLSEINPHNIIDLRNT